MAQTFMKNSFSFIFSDNIIKVTFYIAITLVIIQAIIVLFAFTKLPPLIPFINSRPWGQTRLFPSSSVLLIPTILIVVFVINNFLSVYFYKRNSLVARLLAFNALLFIALTLIALIQIFLLVF